MTDGVDVPKEKNKGSNSLPFKRILSAVMKERGLTLKQIADLAGVKISVIQNWVEGKNPHDLQAVGKLASALGVSFKSLLLGQQEENSKTVSIIEEFEEQEFFDGLAKISIKRLIPRKK